MGPAAPHPSTKSASSIACPALPDRRNTPGQAPSSCVSAPLQGSRRNADEMDGSPGNNPSLCPQWVQLTTFCNGFRPLDQHTPFSQNQDDIANSIQLRAVPLEQRCQQLTMWGFAKRLVSVFPPPSSWHPGAVTVFAWQPGRPDHAGNRGRSCGISCRLPETGCRQREAGS